MVLSVPDFFLCCGWYDKLVWDFNYRVGKIKYQENIDVLNICSLYRRQVNIECGWIMPQNTWAWWSLTFWSRWIRREGCSCSSSLQGSLLRSVTLWPLKASPCEFVLQLGLTRTTGRREKRAWKGGCNSFISVNQLSIAHAHFGASCHLGWEMEIRIDTGSASCHLVMYF